MPRPKSVVPGYRHHAGTGQAMVTVTSASGARRDVYLGRFGSDNSIIEYGRLVFLWKSAQPDADMPGHLSVNELILAFWKFATDCYGADSKELVAFRYALRPLKDQFGLTPAEQFGPKRLIELRQAFIEKGWCRKEVNKQTNRVRRVFKWGVGKEMIPATVWEALRAMPGLPYGRLKIWPCS